SKSELPVPWIRRRVSEMVEDRDFVARLDQTFNDHGDMLDSASPALHRIRSEIRTAQGRVTDRLNSMVSSSEHRTSLQDAIVTMRNGRYVIPVRQEARSKIPGVVHDQSSSGQTLFVEPLVVTELNNRLRELEIDEQQEIQRILQELSGLVAALAPRLTATVLALIDLDLAFAKAKYAGSLRATAPALNDARRVSLLAARHPLLTGKVEPISISLGTDFRLLVITGPNTGGKTVALKTVGLLALMAQSGLHIPVEAGSELPVFLQMFADIGDEQSIEQSLSTFSSHMRNIIEMLPQIDAESLILLDELGAGTDPAEGAALARAILTTLLDSGALGVVTTHYSELKAFAHEVEGVENGSVEFDVQTLSPTYRLTIGLPGRSQALAIAKRLGMNQRVLSLARQHVSTGAVRIEKLLSQIQAERIEIGQLYQRARDVHADSRKLRDRVQTELSTIGRQREDILAGARDEAAGLVRHLRASLRQIESQARGGASQREHRDLRNQVDQAQSAAARALGTLPSTTPVSAPVLDPIRPGASVKVGVLGQQGSVLSVNGGEAEVQVGQFTMRVPVDDLEPLSRKQQEPEPAINFQTTREAPPIELDIRGWRAGDAARELDQYLHDNALHGQTTVRIIHGKGTGALRKAIRQQLESHALVESFQAEESRQGGEGVTVIKLVG
ncbi:MAG: endonuclease MutS2, partial [Chloroflexota bacterium]